MPRHLYEPGAAEPLREENEGFAVPSQEGDLILPQDGELLTDPDLGFQVVIDPPAQERTVEVGRSDDLATRDIRLGSEYIPETFSVVGKDFEMTMDNQLREAITQRGFGKTRKEFLELTAAILADPHGETSIDDFKDTDAGQMARVAHEVTGPLADLIPGKKLAIKGTGLDMEGTRKYLEISGPHRSQLTKQFRDTLVLSRAQKEHAPDGIGGLVSINEAYGVVRWQDPETGQPQEWMLMEYVEDAKPVENKEVVLSRGGITLGFKREQHPELAAFADGPYPSTWKNNVVKFSSLGNRLATELGLNVHGRNEFSDLAGNNLLRQETPDGPRYTVIDIG